MWTIRRYSIDLIVNRALIAHLSLCTRLKPTCNKKIEIMGLVYIFNQCTFNCRAEGPRFKPRWPLNFFNLFSFFNSNKKMIKILTKAHVKIIIIVVENREPYYFIIICKCKVVPCPYFLIRCWFQLLTTNEQSSFYEGCPKSKFPYFIKNQRRDQASRNLREI